MQLCVSVRWQVTYWTRATPMAHLHVYIPNVSKWPLNHRAASYLVPVHKWYHKQSIDCTWNNWFTSSHRNSGLLQAIEIQCGLPVCPSLSLSCFLVDFYQDYMIEFIATQCISIGSLQVKYLTYAGVLSLPPHLYTLYLAHTLRCIAECHTTAHGTLHVEALVVLAN